MNPKVGGEMTIPRSEDGMPRADTKEKEHRPSEQKRRHLIAST